MRIPLLYAFLFLFVHQQAQIACVDNVDFENSTISNWTLSSDPAGPVAYFTGCCSQPGGDFAITASWNGPDLNVNTMPVVPMGGGFKAVMLGTIATFPYDKINTLQRTIQVSASSYLFSFATAIVLSQCNSVTEPWNTACSIYFTLPNGDTIPCSREYYNAGVPSTVAGFNIIANPNIDDTLYYRNWQTRTLDLSPYMGQSVTAHFQVRGCGLGGHFGYMYIDGFCGDMNPVDSLCNSKPVTVCAPSYYNNYFWTAPSGLHYVTPCITTDEPGNYTLKFPVEKGCQMDTFVRSFTMQNLVLGMAYHAVPQNCSGNLVQFNYDSSQPTSTTWPCSLVWNVDGVSYSGPPGTAITHTFSAPGSYSMELIATNCGGTCADTLHTNLMVNTALQAAFLYAPEACIGSNLSFTNTTVGTHPIVQNSWSEGLQTVSSVNANFSFPSPGGYSIQLLVEDSAGCKDSVSHGVWVHDYPHLQLSAQNVCFGMFSQIQASTLPTDTVEHWQWDVDGNGSTEDTLSQISYQYSQAGDYMAYVHRGWQWELYYA